MAEEPKGAGSKEPTKQEVDKQINKVAEPPKAGEKLLSASEVLKDISNDPKFDVNQSQVQPDENQKSEKESRREAAKAFNQAAIVVGSERPVIDRGSRQPGNLGKDEEQVRIKIHSNEYEKGPVDVIVGNRTGTHKFSIPRDKYVTVPRSVVEVLKNTRVVTEVPDMAFHEEHPHAMDESPRMVEESHRRFGMDIQGEEFEE